MSVYKGQEKVLNSITAVEEAKVKEIVDSEITALNSFKISKSGKSKMGQEGLPDWRRWIIYDNGVKCVIPNWILNRKKML